MPVRFNSRDGYSTFEVYPPRSAESLINGLLYGHGDTLARFGITQDFFDIVEDERIGLTGGLPTFGKMVDGLVRLTTTYEIGYNRLSYNGESFGLVVENPAEDLEEALKALSILESLCNGSSKGY